MTASIRFVLQQQTTFPTSTSPLNRVPKTPKFHCGATQVNRPGN